ncbi:MAG: alpha/beta hydrolase [Candidatus Obscuribacterales bacterium]|nr:alpha/beta hydrolase [Steroidobacteraceae bacterium]
MPLGVDETSDSLLAPINTLPDDACLPVEESLMNSTSHANDAAYFPSRGAATIQGTQSFRLNARRVEQQFIIDVAIPALPVQPDYKFPVIYVLDGNGVFGLVAQTFGALSMGPGGLPPAIVVGIGYAIDETVNWISRWLALRPRDFAPTVDKVFVEQARAIPSFFGYADDIEIGRADHFLAFISEELKPFISARFPIDSNDQTIAGISLGGLFAMYVLLNQPECFNRYVVGSPSLWWDERQMFKHEEALASRVSDLPVRLFLSAGALEEAQSPLHRMVSNVDEMATRLHSRNYSSLKLTHHIFSDETHQSVGPATISRGLRSVFLA